MSVMAVTRTVTYTAEAVVGFASAFEFTYTSFAGAPAGGRIVGWDVQNAETTPGNMLRCRLGPSGTLIVVPSGGPPSAINGNAIPLDAGRGYSFAHPEAQYTPADNTVWGVLIVQGSTTSCRVAVTIIVLLPPGVAA